jgi:LysR family transcriptional regulator, low CO2-responsive transcriptional regulator
MLDPYQLRVFLVAAETLNFSRASERLHMSQPSVTQHIQALEAHFNSPLFIRTGRKLALSNTGLALIPLARQMVNLSLKTDEVIESLGKQIHGQLNIACTTTPGKYHLPFLLSGFMEMYPMVQARCDIHSREQAMALLGEGKVHIALSSSLQDFDQNIEFRKFLTDPVVLIAPTNHPWAQQGEITPEELLQARYIFREETSGTYRVVRAGLTQVGININDLQTILTLGNSEAIAIAVQRGIGVGFVSQTMVDNIIEGKVAKIKVRGLEIHQDIFLCRNRLHPLGVLQATFWEYASQTITGSAS